MTGESLLRSIEEGAVKCAERLSKISGSDWKAQRVSLDEGSGDSFQDFLEGVREDHYGVWLSAEGVSFLAIFPRKSGLLVTNAFTRPASEKLDELDNRELTALAEVSNILVNAFAAPLAKARGAEIILSAPKMLIDSQRELFLAALGKAQALGGIHAVGRAHFDCGQLSTGCAIVIFLQP